VDLTQRRSRHCWLWSSPTCAGSDVAAALDDEGAQHPDRDAQLRYINERAREFQVAGDPMISRTKKMEQVGTYKNAGREWHREGKPPRVRTHDFLDRELGKAVPYGIYDLAANASWVNVGIIRVLIT
jgi:hypothetical protein